MDTLDPVFRRLVDDRGLLLRIDDGLCVAGLSEDQLTGESRLLVEYADQALLSRQDTAARLWRTLLDRFPGTSEVLVRAGSGVELTEPWHRYSSYLTLADPPAEVGPDRRSPAAVRATAEHRPLVQGWLVQALREAAHVQDRPFDEEAAAETALELLDDPSCVSFVASRDGVPVGHATVLGEVHDDTTGRDFVELFDVLVEDEVPDGARYRSVLVAAAGRYAHEVGRPLLGHVVHGVGADPGAPVVALLSDRGWRVDHVYWTAPTESLGRVVGA